VTVEEVMTTTAYLDLFLRSVSEPALLKIFLRFILLHRHENVHILDTLTSRINTPFRLCVVSLALFKTLISLHCEDVMLQLVLRYLIPCNHIMFSQRWAVRERDWYSASAARLLALTPVCCSSGITLTFERQEKDYILWRKNIHGAGSPEEDISGGVTDSTCIVEYGKTVDISYLQYLWDAQTLILHCMKDCEIWSAPYDGKNPDPYTFIQTLSEEDGKNLNQSIFRLKYRTPSNSSSSHVAQLGEKMQLELEWDDSYDTGISPGSDMGSPQHDDNLHSVDTQPPTLPPKHIQEMKKNAIMLIKGSYIEESDFQDDVMVYRLCAQKDAQEVNSSKEALTSESPNMHNPTMFFTNDTLKGPQSECSVKNPNATQCTTVEIHERTIETSPQSDLELKLSSTEADHNANVRLLSPENEDFFSQCDNIIKELDSNTTGLVELKLLIPDAISPVEEEEDFENFSADTPSTESMPSPFGPKETWLSNPARIQNIPFTGPFISVVLSKLENMLENSLHVNLLLIGIITHLASYPQPLLRSFLLNTNMVFQPSVRSLYQATNSTYQSPEPVFDDPETEAAELINNMQHNNVTGKSGNLSEPSQVILQPFLGSKAKKGTALPSVPLHIRNAILAAALFPEFLKELAALAQEHSILCYKVFSDFEDNY
ncbi:hypothetical protein JD844_026816, partial [Phrynosoma platyrhinos]